MSNIILTKQAAPINPSTGKKALYVNAIGQLVMRDEFGAERAFASAMRLLPKWRAAIEAAKEGVRPAKLLFFGDSVTAGEGSGTGTLNMVGARANGLALACTAALNSQLGNANADTFFGDQNSTLTGIASVNAYDPRITLGSGWASDTAATTFGGRFLVGTGATAGDLVFSPSGQFDRVTVYWPTLSNLSSALRVKIDGAVVDTLNQAIPASLSSKTYNTTLGTHTVGFNNVGPGNGYVLGVVAWNSANPGVTAIVGGWCGAKAADLDNKNSLSQDNNGNPYPWAPTNALKSIAPDLTVVNITVNDNTAQTALASYFGDLDSIVQAALTVGDVLLVGGWPNNTAGTTNGTLDSYLAAIRNSGANRGCGVIDLRNYFGQAWSVANGLGYTYDNDHPNAAGHSLIGRIIADAILN